MKPDFFILFFFYFISILSTVGYGLHFQKVINIPVSKRCLGFSALIGIFFLTIYSYFSNIFYGHDIRHNSLVLILGLSLFYFNYLKKSFSTKNIKIFISIFLLLFISFLIFKSHDDFPYYHFPYTYYLTQNSSFIGIGQFNHGFRTPSSIFYFNSLFYLPIIKFYLFHIGSAIIFGSAIYIFLSNIIKNIKKKNINYAFYFDLLSLIFILVFFYRLAEHGTDRSAQILVLLIINEIFKIIALKKITNYEISKISILFAITISLKAFYFLYGLLLLPLSFIVLRKIRIGKLIKKVLFNKAFYLSIFLLTLVLMTNFFNTGCLVYPLSSSCFSNFDWSIQQNEIEMMSLHYESWSKAGKTPTFEIDNQSDYVKNFNWVSGWINRYFFFKVTDFLFGLLFLSIVFLTTFYSKIRIKKNVKKEVIYIYLVIGTLLIEWFMNHPALRYGGYSLFFILLFIPISLVLERYKNGFNLIKKKTFIILFIGISIFVLRNIDRIANETKKYDYKVFSNPYHKIDSTYFRFENQIDELIKNFDDCQIKISSCNKKNQFIIKKKMGKYIFIRNK